RMVAPDTAAAAAVARRVIDQLGDRMKFQIINLPFCFMPGYERFMMGDLQKLERHMIFVNNEDVNLAAYLAERRTRKPVCEPCPHAGFCGGVFEVGEVPGAPGVVSPSGPVRPVLLRRAARRSGAAAGVVRAGARIRWWPGA